MKQYLFFTLFIAAAVEAGAQCPPLGPIEGPDRFCVPGPAIFTIPNSSDANLVWTVNPPHYFIGPSTGETVQLPEVTYVEAVLCATPTNPCYTDPPICKTIIPTPKVQEFGLGIDVCDGELVEVPITGQPPGMIFNWITFPGIQPGSGTGDISFTAIYDPTYPFSVVWITPIDGSCAGSPEHLLIEFQPSPPAPPFSDITVCGGSPVTVPLFGTNTAPVTWTNSNPAIGLAASGAGNLNFTAAQVTATEVATITVTQHNTTGCSWLPATFHITVNPLPPTADPPDVTACAGEDIIVNFSAPGSPVFNWTCSNPAVGLPASGTDNIAFTAPSVLTQQTATVTVRATENGCTGPPQAFEINVLPVPEIDFVPDITVCGPGPVTVSLSGTNFLFFSWTCSNPATGLAASGSGSGNLSFTAPAVVAIETATVTVTPALDGCIGSPQTFLITVRPRLVVNPPPNTTACAGQPVAVNFLGSTGAVFKWECSNPAVGLPASGSGNIAFIAPLVTAVETATVTVTPTLDECTGTSQTFSITIRPRPTVTATGGQIGCDTLPVQLKATSPISPMQWAWSGPAGFTSTLQNPTAFKIGTYTVTVTDLTTGCTNTATTKVEQCCFTQSGTVDTALVTICGEKPFVVPHAGNQKLESNDRLRFVLFSNRNNLWGSVLARSDSAFFAFPAGLVQFDSVYYVVAIAGDSLGVADSVNVADPCYSVSKRSAVRWSQKPTVQQLQGAGTVCRNDCVDVVFGFSGQPPFRFVVKILQGGQVLYTRSEVAPALQHTVTVCPKDFNPPGTGGAPMDIQVSELEDGKCGCGG